MINTIDFTTSLIKSRQNQIKESFNRKRIKESTKDAKEEIKEATLETNARIVEEAEPEDEAKVEVETEIEAPEEEAEVINDAEGFEETIEDTVHFCVQCNKHFLASPDTPDDEIVCPICGEKELVIDMGTAQEALDEADNEEVAEEIAVKDEEDVAVEEPEEDEFEFDESDLEEGLRCLAKRYINEKALLRIKRGSLKDGNLVLEGIVFPGRKRFTVTFDKIQEKLNSKSDKFVLEGRTDMFKSSKLKGLFVRENNVIKLKKCGYGLIKESKKGNTKIKGILG